MVNWNYKMKFKKLLNRWKEILIITAGIELFLFGYSLFINHKSVLELWPIWVRWDGPHYIDIAKFGYQTTGEPALFIVFYPLYPILIKISSFFFNDYLFSTILVSTIFSVLTSIVLFELVLLDHSRKVAILSVFFLHLFPTAYFFQASYTESLFLFSSLGTIYFYRKKYFMLSGIFGLLSTMTRINGVLLIPLLLFESNFKLTSKKLLTLILTPIGFVIYLLINKYYFGDFFYFQKPLLSNWYKKFEWPWISLKNSYYFANSQTGINHYIFSAELIVFVIFLLLGIYVFFKIRKSYGIYMLLNLFLFSSTSFIMSTPRYVLILFPVYILLAVMKRPIIQAFISILFTVLLLYLTYLYTNGQWAY